MAGTMVELASHWYPAPVLEMSCGQKSPWLAHVKKTTPTRRVRCISLATARRGNRPSALAQPWLCSSPTPTSPLHRKVVLTVVPKHDA